MTDERRLGNRLGGWIAMLVLAAVVAVFSFPWCVRLVYPIPFRAQVERAAWETGLDPFLIVAMMKVESRFNPKAESRKGARGLMQVMPETGAWVAAQLGMDRFHPDLLFDPDVNVLIGAWYFAHLQSRFGGEPVLALAAYNGGQGNVRKWLENSLWDGTVDHVHRIPFAETRAYVRRVMTTYSRYRWAYAGRWEETALAEAEGRPTAVSSAPLAAVESSRMR